MNTILENLFTNWHFMRWLRLGLGIFVAVQAIQHRDVLAGMIACFFFFQVITNTGCCGTAGCSVPSSDKKVNNAKEVDYEEIKPTEK